MDRTMYLPYVFPQALVYPSCLSAWCSQAAQEMRPRRNQRYP
jgi:hypothetical protein